MVKFHVTFTHDLPSGERKSASRTLSFPRECSPATARETLVSLGFDVASVTGVRPIAPRNTWGQCLNKTGGILNNGFPVK